MVNPRLVVLAIALGACVVEPTSSDPRSATSSIDDTGIVVDEEDAPPPIVTSDPIGKGIAIVGDSTAVGFGDVATADPMLDLASPFPAVQRYFRLGSADAWANYLFPLVTGDLGPYTDNASRPPVWPINVNMGFELALGHTLIDSGGDYPLIAKHALGSASAAEHYRPSAGYAYHDAIDHIRAAEVVSGETIGTLIIALGPNDSVSETQANAFEDSLRTIVTKAREDLPNVRRVILVRPCASTATAHMATVLAKFDAVLASDPSLIAISTDDIALSADRVHRTSTGDNTVGQRIASAILEDDAH